MAKLLKRPKEPWKPYKPVEPTKVVEVTEYLRFSAGSNLVDEMSAKYPHVDIKDVFIDTIDSYEESTELLHYIRKTISNPRYAEEMKYYTTAVAKYEKDLLKYKKELETYKPALAAYNEQELERDFVNTEKRYKELLKKRKVSELKTQTSKVSFSNESIARALAGASEANGTSEDEANVVSLTSPAPDKAATPPLQSSKQSNQKA